MEILHYSVNIEKLKNIQKAQAEKDDADKIELDLQGQENKKRLLKYALPFVHSVLELHNNKCNLSNSSTTGRDGLLGYSKENVDRYLDYIVNTDSHLVWKNNYQVFTFVNKTINGKRDITIWLNSREGSHRATPNLEYSMTSHFDVYGISIEDELEKIAKLCSIYKDNW